MQHFTQAFGNGIRNFPTLLRQNWKAGLTVAFISVPLSIALSIASGAGPVPGLITGVWATLIASLFASSNYNIIGPAGALSTILFAATVAPAFGIGAAILPLLAIAVGFILLLIWAVNADRFLYYVPTSIVHGFAAGVAVLIAFSQIFDATGLALKRTGHFIGDVELFAAHTSDVQFATLAVFAVFLAFILVWKKYIKAVPAVIPAVVLGILFGFIVKKTGVIPLDITTLLDKFGSIKGALWMPVEWGTLKSLLTIGGAASLFWKTAILVAVIAVLETLITARIGDKITRTQSSSRRELFGLALANLGSGVAGGLPATGVFLRTGANIKAGATHRTAAGISAIATALIALVVLPLFVYLPVAVIAAMLINTAIGLVETEKFKEYWHHDKQSFVIAIMVAVITIIEDPGLAVLIGVVVALVLFVDRVSRGHSGLTLNMIDGTYVSLKVKGGISLPSERVAVAVYSLAGNASYVDASQHAANLRTLARAKNVDAILIRMRDCYAIDFDTVEMLADAVSEAEAAGKRIAFTSIHDEVRGVCDEMPKLHTILEKSCYSKTEAAVNALRKA